MLSRALLLPAALLVSTPVFAQEAAPAARPGQIEVGDFRGVQVGYGIKAEVKEGAKSVRLEGNPEDVARVKLQVKDGVLTTTVDKKSGSWFGNSGAKGVRLYVTNPRVERVGASGGAHVEAQATATEEFEAEASGGAQLSVTGVQARKLELEASGGSQVTVQGRASELELEASGGSQVHARELQAETLQVEASGGARIEANVERSIRGSLSGGSEVLTSKKPAEVRVNTSGGSRVSSP